MPMFDTSSTCVSVNVQNLQHVHKHMPIFQNITVQQCFVCLLTLILCNAASAKKNISLLQACGQCAARADIPKTLTTPSVPCLCIIYICDAFILQTTIPSDLLAGQDAESESQCINSVIYLWLKMKIALGSQRALIPKTSAPR